MRSSKRALIDGSSWLAFALPPRDARLRRAAAFSGAWAQHMLCFPLASSLQRSPFALMAAHLAIS